VSGGAFLMSDDPRRGWERRLHPCTFPVLWYGVSLVCAIVVASAADTPGYGAVCVLGALIVVTGPARSLLRGAPVVRPQAQRLADAITALDGDPEAHILVAAQDDISVPYSVRHGSRPMVLAAPGFIDGCDDEHLRAVAALALSELRDAAMSTYARRWRDASLALICVLVIAGTQLVPHRYSVYGAFAPLGLAQWLTIIAISASSRRQGLARMFVRTDDTAVALAGAPILVADTLRSAAAWRAQAHVGQTPAQRVRQLLAQPLRPDWHEARRARRLDPDPAA